MSWFEYFIKYVLKHYFLFIDTVNGTTVLLDEKGNCLTPLEHLQLIIDYPHYDGRRLLIYRHRRIEKWILYELDEKGRVLREKTFRKARRLDKELQRAQDERYYQLEKITSNVRIYTAPHPDYGYIFRITGKNAGVVLFEGNTDVTLQTAVGVTAEGKTFEFDTYWAPFAFFTWEKDPSIIQIRLTYNGEPVYTGPCYNDPPL